MTNVREEWRRRRGACPDASGDKDGDDVDGKRLLDGARRKKLMYPPARANLHRPRGGCCCPGQSSPSIAGSDGAPYSP